MCVISYVYPAICDPEQLLCFYIYGQNPVPVQQPSAKPCSFPAVIVGNALSYIPIAPKSGAGTGIRTIALSGIASPPQTTTLRGHPLSGIGMVGVLPHAGPGLRREIHFFTLLAGTRPDLINFQTAQPLRSRRHEDNIVRDRNPVVSAVPSIRIFLSRPSEVR